MYMDEIFGALAEAGIDTLIILPFLLAVHILIEWFEHSAVSRIRFSKMLNGWYAPAAAGVLGLVPQCGFSVVATKLFSKKNIRMGTLLAVYIATSDEAIPILIANPDTWGKLWPLLSIKLVYAIAAGYAVNILTRAKGRAEPVEAGNVETIGCHGHSIRNRNRNRNRNCKYGGDLPESESEPRGQETRNVGADLQISPQNAGDCGDFRHSHPIESTPDKESNARKIWKFLRHPIFHTLTIGAFILAVNIVFNLLLNFIGEDAMFNFLNSAAYAQPFIAGTVGLIPNCGASVVITQAYALGGLSLGAAVSGLSISAGVAYAVLFKENKRLKQNLLIIGGLYVSSCILGVLITFAYAL